MAHHGSTPKSILEAPTPEPVVFYRPRGLTRAQRRGRAPVAKGQQRRLRNQPLVGDVVRDLFPKAGL